MDFHWFSHEKLWFSLIFHSYLSLPEGSSSMWSFSRNLPFVDPVPGISRPGPATVFPIWPSSGCWRTCRPSRRGNTRGYPRVSWSTFIQCECGKSPFKIRKSPIAGPFSNIFHSYVGLLESIHIYIYIYTQPPLHGTIPLGKNLTQLSAMAPQVRSSVATPFTQTMQNPRDSNGWAIAIFSHF